MGGGKNKKEANRSPFSRIYALFHSGFSMGKKDVIPISFFQTLNLIP